MSDDVDWKERTKKFVNWFFISVIVNIVLLWLLLPNAEFYFAYGIVVLITSLLVWFNVYWFKEMIKNASGSASRSLHHPAFAMFLFTFIPFLLVTFYFALQSIWYRETFLFWFAYAQVMLVGLGTLPYYAPRR